MGNESIKNDNELPNLNKKSNGESPSRYSNPEQTRPKKDIDQKDQYATKPPDSTPSRSTAP